MLTLQNTVHEPIDCTIAEEEGDIPAIIRSPKTKPISRARRIIIPVSYKPALDDDNESNSRTTPSATPMDVDSPSPATSISPYIEQQQQRPYTTLPPPHKIFPKSHAMRWHKVKKPAPALKQALQFLTSSPPVFDAPVNQGWELGADSLEYAVKFRVFERNTRDEFCSTIGAPPKAFRKIIIQQREESASPELVEEPYELNLAEKQQLLRRLGPLPALNPFTAYYSVAGYSPDELMVFAQKYKLEREAEDFEERARRRRKPKHDPKAIHLAYNEFMRQRAERLGDAYTPTVAVDEESAASDSDESPRKKAKIDDEAEVGGIKYVEFKPYKELEAEWERDDLDNVKRLKDRKEYLVAGLYSAYYKGKAAQAAAQAILDAVVVIEDPNEMKDEAPVEIVVEGGGVVKEGRQGKRRSSRFATAQSSPAKEEEDDTAKMQGDAQPELVADNGSASSGSPNNKTVKKFQFPMPRNFGITLMNTEKEFQIPLDIMMYVDAKGGSKLAKKAPARREGPTGFYKLQRNQFVDRKAKKAAEPAVCRCEVPEDEDTPACGENCLNRCMFIECDPESCPCGDKCTNQNFQRRNFVKKLKVAWTGGRGHGLQTMQDIGRNQLVLEYCGEIISAKTYNDRMENDYADSTNYYILAYGDGEVVDAALKGTDARFVNHSCDPNCRIEKWSVGGEFCIGLFADEDIEPGTELTYDYRFQPFLPGPMLPCLCGAANCRGFLGNNKKKEEVKEEDNTALGKKNRLAKLKGADMRKKNNNQDRGFWLRKHAREKLAHQSRDIVKWTKWFIEVQHVFLVRNLTSKIRVEKLAETVGIPPPPALLGRGRRDVAAIANATQVADEDGIFVVVGGDGGKLTAKNITDEQIRVRAGRRNRSLEDIVDDLIAQRK
ncbi:histone-lysine N-methyltransferase [Synchytrium microbalum]|uniref:Histone-lysine N-methyltransferase n=1 Tax=Synchytrium microbalum TaxID=1806994 RepID=A0A507CFA5_9FUNG|nr:histone-lysine N-methyltransferase [Synchytrium microbalum]TPX38181.1 histone-lysine N-methyltransferase [Synchytrium microbalum]